MRASLNRSFPHRAFSFHHLSSTALVHGISMMLALAVPVASGQAQPAPATPANASATATPLTMDAAPAKVTARRPGSRGAHEGIQVRGYWKIDVKNPDGTLAKHIEFENSLVTGYGSSLLLSLLEGADVSLGPTILVNGAGGTPEYSTDPGSEIEYRVMARGPCGTYQGTGTGCLLTSSTNPLYSNCLWLASHNVGNYTSSACLSGLSISPAAPALDSLLDIDQALVLTGSITVGSSTTITNVGTMFTGCAQANLTSCAPPPTPGSSPIPNAKLGFLTSYIIPGGLPVTVGQAVNVTVKLSFQ